MKTMPNTNEEEKMRWIKPLIEKQVKIKTMSEICPFSERTLKYWLRDYRSSGYNGLINRSTRPRSQPNETLIRTKERILELRKETDLSALKLHWKLRKESIQVSARTVGRILKREGLTRKYRQRKKYPPRTKTIFLPGELVEIDIKYVPKIISGKKYYQFTAIDIASKWRYLEVFDDYGNYASIKLLKKLISIALFEIKAIKTDNGPNFTNRYTGYQKSIDPLNPRLHPLDIECQKLNIIHYLIDPGKPQQNGTVERSYRSDQESFYNRISYETIDELNYQIRLWNMYYNDLEHYSLNGRTPNECLKVQNVLSSLVQTVL